MSNHNLKIVLLWKVSSVAEALGAVQKWATQVVTSGYVSFEELSTLEVPDRLNQAVDAQDLFERLEFSHRNPDADDGEYEDAVRVASDRVLRMADHDGWSAVSAALF